MTDIGCCLDVGRLVGTVSGAPIITYITVNQRGNDGRPFQCKPGGTFIKTDATF